VLNSFAPKRTKRSVLPQKYVRGRFSKKIRNANVLFEDTKLRSEKILPPLAPYTPFGADSYCGVVS
jgi:hypothetical protein